MKNRITGRQRLHALTLIEVLVVVVVSIIFVGLFLPGTSHGKVLRFNCAFNLKQIGIAYRLWSNDQSDAYSHAIAANAKNSPVMGVKWPTTGTPDAPVESPYTYLVFAAMSNELNTPKVVVCPSDDRLARTNFGSDFVGPTGGHNLGVSYFVGRDAATIDLAAFLAGDRNICADTTVTPIPNHGYGISPDGIEQGAACAFPTNLSHFRNLGWSPKMHRSTGNVGLADGSVQQYSVSGLIAGLKASAAASTNLAAQNYLLFP